jgi:predicted RNase H-like HicB family nuclease
MHAFTVVVHKDDDGSFWAEVEELPGCFASGKTLDELEEDVKGAIEQHIAALKELGETIPDLTEAKDPDERRWRVVVAA